MGKKYKIGTVLFWLSVGLYAGFMVGIITIRPVGYKEGQEDALSGEWKYEYRADTLLYKIPQP